MPLESLLFEFVAASFAHAQSTTQSLAQHTLIPDRSVVSLLSEFEFAAASFAHAQSTSGAKLEIAQNKKKNLLINKQLFFTFLFGLGTRLRRAYESFSWNFPIKGHG